jgi:multidrug resistance efflux pump
LIYEEKIALCRYSYSDTGRILKECWKEGDAVTKGATVIELENDDLKASVEQALAGVEKAKAEICVSESAIESAKANILSSEADIKNAEADIEKARVQMEEAKRHMDRFDALYKKELISKESFETAITIMIQQLQIIPLQRQGSRLYLQRGMLL